LTAGSAAGTAPLTESERQVFELVKEKVVEVLVDVDPGQVTPERSLAELGANSLDRVEVAMLSMEALELRIPPTELAGVANLGALARLLSRHLGAG
jgi:polyketide biosynthesis acyl carrier protein